MTTHLPATKATLPLRRQGTLFKERVTKTGFNLVEVVLAMCVIAIAFTSLFGVLPVAMQNYRHSISLTTQANILSQVSGELEQTPPSEITANPLTNRFFDDEGREITSATQTAIYRVDYTPSATSGNTRTSVNSTIFGPNSNNSLLPVTISIYNNHSVSTNSLSQVTIFIPNY